MYPDKALLVETNLMKKYCVVVFGPKTMLASKPLLDLFIPEIETRLKVSAAGAFLRSVGESSDKAH